MYDKKENYVTSEGMFQYYKVLMTLELLLNHKDTSFILTVSKMTSHTHSSFLVSVENKRLSLSCQMK